MGGQVEGKFDDRWYDSPKASSNAPRQSAGGATYCGDDAATARWLREKLECRRRETVSTTVIELYAGISDHAMRRSNNRRCWIAIRLRQEYAYFLHLGRHGASAEGRTARSVNCWRRMAFQPPSSSTFRPWIHSAVSTSLVRPDRPYVSRRMDPGWRRALSAHEVESRHLRGTSVLVALSGQVDYAAWTPRGSTRQRRVRRVFARNCRKSSRPNPPKNKKCMVIGYAIGFVRRYRSFVTRSLATLCQLSPHVLCTCYFYAPTQPLYEGTRTMPDVELVR